MTVVGGTQLLAGAFSIEAPFWEALGHGELRLPQCVSCAHWNWPPVPRCPRCGSYEHAWSEVEPAGSLYSWTTIHRASRPTLADEVPFVVALVELPGAGNARIMGRFEGPEEGLAIGAPVVGAFRPPSALTSDMPTIVWSKASDEGAVS